MVNNHKYELKSGQINFENVNQRGAYACIVIRDGKIYNLTDDLRQLLLAALNKEPEISVDLEDMF